MCVKGPDCVNVVWNCFFGVRGQQMFCVVYSECPVFPLLHCCVLYAHAFLSLCDNFKSYRTKKLAKNFFCVLQLICPLGPGKLSAHMGACSLAGRLLWASTLIPWFINSIYCRCIAGQILTLVGCLLVLFIFSLMVWLLSLNSVWIPPVSLSRQKRIKSHLAHSLPQRTAL